MGQVTMQLIQELRARTSVSISKCKEALESSNGDIDAAIELLRKQGMASAGKKQDRETNEGTISFFDSNDTIALVEVNAETDFVVKNQTFQDFVKATAEELAKTKPASLEDFSSQPYSKDTSITNDQFRSLTIQAVGENIKVKRFLVESKKANSSIALYSHMQGKIVTLVEIEGDSQQHALAYDIALHTAASGPEYLDRHSVPAELIEKEKEIVREQSKDKPAAMLEKIVDGKLQAYYKQICLLDQGFIKDESISIEGLIAKKSKELGKELKLVRFIRWSVS
jgi:elongation factor Ts